MHVRVNLTLPADTIRLLDRTVRKGDRSRLVNRAVRHYIESLGKAKLRKLLKEGAVQRGGREALLAEEWFGIE
jgi:metal-responsive CopG/Arc/MetJ family transcriptional regulator